jgi:hypothetical protein
MNRDADFSSSNSCKNSTALVPPPPVLKQARELTTMATVLVAEEPMLDPGSAAQLVALPLGAVGTRMGTTKVEPRPPVRLAARRRGLATVAIVIVEPAAGTTGSKLTLTTVAEILTVEVLLRLAPLLGTKLLRLLQLTQALMRLMVPMALLRE